MLLNYLQWIEELSAKLQADLRAQEADLADLKAYKTMMDLEEEAGDSFQWRALLMRMLPAARTLDEAMKTYNDILEKKHDIVIETSRRAAHCRMRAYEAREQLEQAVVAARQELAALLK